MYVNINIETTTTATILLNYSNSEWSEHKLFLRNEWIALGSQRWHTKRPFLTARSGWWEFSYFVCVRVCLHGTYVCLFASFEVDRVQMIHYMCSYTDNTHGESFPLMISRPISLFLFFSLAVSLGICHYAPEPLLRNNDDVDAPTTDDDAIKHEQRFSESDTERRNSLLSPTAPNPTTFGRDCCGNANVPYCECGNDATMSCVA